MVRWIKLKEFDLNVDTTVAPTDDYLKNCDNSIVKQEFRFRTDAAGFIRSGEPAFDTDRIIVLGDSSAASFFVPENERLGAVIERHLRTAGRNADVLMGATSDCTTLHAINILLNKGLPLKPTTLLYMSCGSDSAALSTDAGYWLNDPEKLLGPIAQAAIGTDEMVRELPDLDARRAMLQVMLRATEIYGIELILVTVPFRRKIDEYLTSYYKNEFTYHNRLTRMKHAINNSTRHFAREYRLTCIDTEMFSDRGELFYDIVHLNQHGCQTVGAMIAERIPDSSPTQPSHTRSEDVR
jgi:hypothetical protein